MIKGWKYYNHAVIPTTAPHEKVDIAELESGYVWLQYPKAILARWTTDWDCDHETDWWYVIKDTPLDITLLKSKKRYEINKGNKNFVVKTINAEDFIDDIERVTTLAYSGWPKKYRPNITKQIIVESIKTWKDYLVFGGFSSDEGILQGYALVQDHGDYADFSQLRTNPYVENLGINAALIAGIMLEYCDRFTNGFYICDGARSIRHETAFQSYLEKYFCFRKAYCKLHIKYKGAFGIIVKILYPLRKIISGNSKIGNQLKSIMKMEEILRSEEELL